MTRRPGEWPVPKADLIEAEPQHQRAGTAEAARFALTLGSIRASLEEQPSESTVRSAARHWTNAIAQLAEEVAAAKRRTG
ncbi:hypothetical protein ACIP9H_29485 [Streptomyces sp. NPDC088732]|uniref:hypothetical protein n=1 Tax=Streptomyces sp. NPDC088732 TaxID=3365879 RepID=UPI0037F1350C